MTLASRLVVSTAAAALLLTSSQAAPGFVFHDVAFVTLVGHGTVRSLPVGISCPKVCRVAFRRGTHIRFTATPAAGWTFAGFSSQWCPREHTTCAFDLLSTHDCAGGACPVGAFGVRATFVRRQ